MSLRSIGKAISVLVDCFVIPFLAMINLRCIVGAWHAMPLRGVTRPFPSGDCPERMNKLFYCFFGVNYTWIKKHTQSIEPLQKLRKILDWQKDLKSWTLKYPVYFADTTLWKGNRSWGVKELTSDFLNSILTLHSRTPELEKVGGKSYGVEERWSYRVKDLGSSNKIQRPLYSKRDDADVHEFTKQLAWSNISWSSTKDWHSFFLSYK